MKTQVEIKSRPIEITEKKGNKTYKTDRPSFNFKESNDFSLKHETVKNRVLSILRSDRYARKNDFYLCLLYWIKTGQIKMEIDFKEFESISKPESISRCRRELIKDAKNGIKELNFLLNDEETLNEREKLKNFNHDYYQDKLTSELSKRIK